MKNHAALNRIYRLVWSAVNCCWVAVAETAKGQGKAATRRKVMSPLAKCEHTLTYKLAKALLLALVPAITMITPGIAQAGLEGGVIVGGQGTIVNPNLVIQNSARLAINAQGFNVGAGEVFNLQQQSASDMALIRILGQNPSDIFGTINAKGQLLISNPNGILFGKDSQVNVGGLIATTLNIDTADFMFGNYNFYKNKRKLGAVVNQGNLTAADGGYIALLAPEARNEGVINAHLGTAAIIAGNKITLDLNDGALVSYAIDKGAINALAENKHLIQADGGQVLMGAKAANSLTTAVINNTGIIRARTVQNQSGRIMLMGDMQVGTVNVDGTLDASAPAELNPGGGNGGFIETSAAHVKVADSANVTALAANGSNATYQNGTWLIDPNDFTIGATGDMSGAAVNSALAGGNFTIQTTSMGTAGGNGDIFVNEAVNWNTNNTFTLNAERNININADITATGANGKLNLFYGQASATGGANDNYFIAAGNVVNLQAGNNFSTQKGTAGPVINYTVITDVSSLPSLSAYWPSSHQFALGADIDASTLANSISLFVGKLDGLGHVISNFTYTGTLTGYGGGLFGGILYAGTVVQNLGVVNATVINNTVYTNTGILAGMIRDGVVIRNVWTSGSVSSQGYAGGLAGYVDGTTIIQDSFSSANVTTTSNSNGTGGFVGALGENAVIINSHASGNVQGVNNVGGLVGTLYSQAQIINSYFGGNVTATGNYYGGLVGASYSSQPSLELVNSHYNIDTVSINGGPLVTPGGIYGSQFSDWFTNNKTLDIADYAASLTFDSGTGRYQISTLQGLKDMLGFSTAGYDFSLKADLDVSGISGGWFIPRFSGGFDGENHTLTGLSIHQNNNYLGFVGRTVGDTSFSNLNLTDVDISGLSWLGGLAGFGTTNNTVNNVHVVGTIAGGDSVLGGSEIGGFIGELGENGIINNSSANVTVVAPYADDVGGFVGSAWWGNSSISNSSAAGNVSGRSYVGGLVGGAWDLDITNSYATGTVIGLSDSYSVGGLVGELDNGRVESSWASGTVSGDSLIGGLIGYVIVSDGHSLQIADSYATGDVNATSGAGIAGGLIGEIDVYDTARATIIRANASGDVNNGIYGYIAGGLIGQTYNSPRRDRTQLVVEDSHASGNIFCGERCGGLIGEAYSTIVRGSDATGNVTADYQIAGGLIAYAQDVTIESSHAGGNVVSSYSGSNGSYVGGLVGHADNMDMVNNYYSGAIIQAGSDYVGGLVGYLWTAGVTAYSVSKGEAYVDGRFSGNYLAGPVDVSGRDYVGGLIGGVEGNYLVAGNSTLTANHTGTVTGRDYVGGLIGKNGGDINNDYKGFDIANSSNIGTVTASGSGASSGSQLDVDGLAHISGSGDFVGGLVGHNYNANITNSWASGDVSATGTYAGGLVGRDDSNNFVSPTIANSYASGNVTGRAFVGGLAGETFFVDVSNSYATGNVNGTINLDAGNDRYVGGLVGYSYQGSFTNTYATGNVIGGAQVGGLLGMNDSSIVTLSRAEGNVTGGWKVGGLAGENYGLVTDSYARGNVTGVATTGSGGDMFGDDIGGLVGWASADDIIHTYATGAVNGHDRVGGLVGFIDSGRSVRESYAMNTSVTGHNMVGGLVGANQAMLGKLGIIDSYADSPVTGNDRVGGLVGYNGGESGFGIPGKVTRSYAAGLVTGNTNVGGLIGDHYTAANLPTDSYWNTETTGQATSAGGAGVVGKTTAEMQTLATFAGWDIDDAGGTGKVWRMYEGQTSPLLRYFLNPLTITADSVTQTYTGLAYTGGSVSYSDPTPLAYTLNGGPTYTGTSQGVINVGSYGVSAATSNYSSPQNSGFNQLKQNYDISYADGTVTIDPAPLTITANNAVKTYNGQAYAGGNGVTYSGFVNGETSTVLAGGLIYGGSSQGAVSPGSYGISASGFSSGNYAISYVPGTLAITYTTPIDTTPVLAAAYNGAKDVSSGVCTVNGLSGAEAFVPVINGRFALTEVTSFELDADGVVTDTHQLELSSNCMCDDTNRTFKNVDVTVLSGGVRMPDNRLSSYRNQENLSPENIEIIKTPRVIRSRSAL